LAELRGSELVAKLLPQQSPAKLDRQTDPHQLIWIQASLLIAQLDGLRDGFNSASTDDGEVSATLCSSEMNISIFDNLCSCQVLSTFCSENDNNRRSSIAV
jgi:hypothetical protein